MLAEVLIVLGFFFRSGSFAPTKTALAELLGSAEGLLHDVRVQEIEFCETFGFGGCC